MCMRHARHLAVIMLGVIHVVYSMPADVTSSDTRPSVTEDPRSSRNSPSSDQASSVEESRRLNSPDSQSPGSASTQGGSISQGSTLLNQNSQDGRSPAERPNLPGPPPFGPPCRVILLSNNSVLVNQQCPPGSNCTETPPRVNDDPNREINVFFCTPPPGFRELFPAGGILPPRRCLVVDKETNETRFNAPCPQDTSCQVLDQRNPDSKVDIFLCTQPTGDVVNQERLPPCKVVNKSTGTTVVSTDCPPNASCTEVDQRNQDPKVVAYKCARSSQSSNNS